VLNGCLTAGGGGGMGGGELEGGIGGDLWLGKRQKGGRLGWPTSGVLLA